MGFVKNLYLHASETGTRTEVFNVALRGKWLRFPVYPAVPNSILEIAAHQRRLPFRKQKTSPCYKRRLKEHVVRCLLGGQVREIPMFHERRRRAPCTASSFPKSKDWVAVKEPNFKLLYWRNHINYHICKYVCIHMYIHTCPVC